MSNKTKDCNGKLLSVGDAVAVLGKPYRGKHFRVIRFKGDKVKLSYIGNRRTYLTYNSMYRRTCNVRKLRIEELI